MRARAVAIADDFGREERTFLAWGGGGGRKKRTVCRGLEHFPSDSVQRPVATVTGVASYLRARVHLHPRVLRRTGKRRRRHRCAPFREFGNFPLLHQSIVFDGQPTRSRSHDSREVGREFCFLHARGDGAREPRQLAWPPKQQVFCTEKLCGGGGDDLCSSARSVVTNREPREFSTYPLNVVRAIDFRPPSGTSEARIRCVRKKSHLVSR